jgi:vacuolar-type H+-ATPase subunit F/Vma7
MAALVYIGDELSAAGYRLAGASVATPAPEQAAQALALALTQAPLVLLSAALASAIPPATLRRAACALRPLLLVVPDIVGGTPAPELVQRLRGQLVS